MDGDQTVPSAKTKKKTGMETTRGNCKAATAATAPGTDDPNAAPLDPKLLKTPELSEVQFKDI